MCGPRQEAIIQVSFSSAWRNNHKQEILFTIIIYYYFVNYEKNAIISRTPRWTINLQTNLLPHGKTQETILHCSDLIKLIANMINHRGGGL